MVKNVEYIGVYNQVKTRYGIFTKGTPVALENDKADILLKNESEFQVAEKKETKKKEE